MSVAGCVDERDKFRITQTSLTTKLVPRSKTLSLGLMSLAFSKLSLFSAAIFTSSGYA